MADDDDVPEELWDMLDNLGNSKVSTLYSRLPATALLSIASAKAADTALFWWNAKPHWYCADAHDDPGSSRSVSPTSST